MPSAQISLRASARRAAEICSGAMYAGVPSTELALVRSLSPSGAVAMPKSRILSSGGSSGVCVTNRFEPLMSRCTIPSECASARASHACNSRSTAIAGTWRPWCLMIALRSEPSRYSITMYGVSDSGILPTSITRAMCSPLSFTAAFASRRKRATTSGRSSISGSRHLIATFSSSSTCRALSTTPIPPSPITDSTQYLSIIEPGAGWRVVVTAPAHLARWWSRSTRACGAARRRRWVGASTSMTRTGGGSA